MVQTRVTFDVSGGGKVKAGRSVQMIRHWARDVDARNGIYRAHSNQGIDALRSINNETWFPTDGPRSEWTQPKNIEEISDRLAGRLATVTGRKRKDAVVMRGVVLQLSPEWIEAHTPNWKTDPKDRAAYMDALQPVVDRVIERAGGAKNVILVTGHFDEVAPQIQMAVTPVTEDGRLRQNDFDLFRSPGSLRKMHKEIREELKASGLDVIMESSERSREHLSNLEFARKADQEREKEKKQLAEEKKQLAEQAQQLDADRAKLDEDMEAVRLLRQRTYKASQEQGYKAGYKEGLTKAHKRIEGAKRDAQDLVQQAQQQAQQAQRERQEAADLVRQAQAKVLKLKADRDRLEEETQTKKQRIARLDEELMRKHSEGEKLVNDAREKAQKLEADADSAKSDALQIKQQAEADAAKIRARALKNIQPLRDRMVQSDSEFLDHLLRDPRVREQREEFVKDIKIGYLTKTPVQRQRDEDRVTLSVAEYSKKYPSRNTRQPQQEQQQERDRERDRDREGDREGDF